MIWNDDTERTTGIIKEKYGRLNITYVDIVLCKNCIHGYRCKNAAGEDAVECSNRDVSLEPICRKPDWFCADGRRKE